MDKKNNDNKFDQIQCWDNSKKVVFQKMKKCSKKKCNLHGQTTPR